MGWNPFKSKTKVTVSTSVSRVIEDKLVPDSLKTGVIKGVFEGDQLVENIMEDIVASIGIRAERMYQYGKKHSPFGLPSSTLLNNIAGKDVVQSLLNQLTGTPVTIEYYHYGPLNNLHAGWSLLCQNYGYNPATNELVSLSKIKGFPVYLSDMQVVITNATAEELVNGSLEQWGTPANSGYTPLRPITGQGVATPYAIDATASQDYFRVSYAWKDTATIQTDTLTFPVGSENPNLGYFQAKYSYGAITKYWTYRDGAGTYPVLDATFNTEHDALGSFFPWCYFRFDKRSTASDTGSSEYKTSTKLMKFLGMDYQEVADSINENPDIDDVESAFLMLAVPASTGDEAEQRYLFDFFKSLYVSRGITESIVSSETKALVTRSSVSQTSLVIQDARFKMNINLAGIHRTVKAGALGAIGSHSSSVGSYTYHISRTTYASKADTEGTTRVSEYTVPCHYYRKQITSSLYEEIEVRDLEVAYFVEDNYKAVADISDGNLLIPLDRSITKEYPPSVREKLYARSMHFVINSKVETKIKWYQRGWFRIFMTIVAIVITIFSMGGLSGVSAAIMAATATTAALISTVISLVLNYLIFTVAMKYFVKVLGAKVAMILAVVAISFGMYSQIAGGVANAPWAADLIKVASGLTNAISDHFSDALLGLQKEADLFSLYAKEQTELLENTKDLLTQNTLLSPFTVFGESPENYYQRTVHSGNIGILGIDAVSEFTTTMLRLPTLSDTLQTTTQDWQAVA